MSCVVCGNLTEEELVRVKEQYLGGADAEKLACDYSQKFEDMRMHCAKCIKIVKSRFERLNDMIDNLGEDCELARSAYQGDAERADLAGAYAMLLRELRMTIESTQNMVKPEDQVDELIEAVLRPLLFTMVKSATEEVGKLRDELVTAGMNEDQVGQACKARLTALGMHMKRAIQDAVSNLNKYYGVNVTKTIAAVQPTLQKAASTIH